MQRAKLGAKVALLLPAFILLWGAWSYFEDARLHNGFDRVTAGMTEREVLEVLGAPSEEPGCGPGVFVPALGVYGCAATYAYASPWAPLVPDYPVVWFDASGRVIDKYEFQSP